jgi:hypothetical protein
MGARGGLEKGMSTVLESGKENAATIGSEWATKSRKERKKELLLGGVEVEKMQLQLYTLRSSSSLVFPFLRGMVLA